MAYLMRTSSSFLGENIDFERESYLEGFIFGNPMVLSVSQDSPEGLVPVYIIGRQDIIKLEHKTGITDLTCLIWDPNLNKYEIWIFELKVYANSIDNVNQLTGYLEGVKYHDNEKYRDEIFQRAIDMVGENYVDIKSEIRGALCAQSFSDDVLQKILEENTSRKDENNIVAVKIFTFPVDNENFVYVERLVGEEKSSTGGPMNYYDLIPCWQPSKLEEELLILLKQRKENNRERFEQLRVFLEFFVNDPEHVLSQDELRKEWKAQGLKEQDQGLSVSQVMGYKNSGSLRQMFTWVVTPYMAVKEDYRLNKPLKKCEKYYKDTSYSEIISKVLQKL
jgi:hypothetical protein